MVLPQNANALGNVFGGQVMAWIDICAAVAAQRHCRSGPLVTASIDAVHFLAPIKLGHVVVLRGQVNAAFTTSVECGVSVFAEDPATGAVEKAVKAYATFVALDKGGRPHAVPPLVLETPADQRRAEDANARRRARLALKAEAQARAAAEETPA